MYIVTMFADKQKKGIKEYLEYWTLHGGHRGVGGVSD